ncbi:MAG TPA: dihydrofolate reductase [Lacibacter sp.]|nr:dihydrofolate reductase [Lacibacter sp.]HMO87649.1 dihydrofolate reductase [Lacibacter sp.]
MILSHIVAAGTNDAIGKNNQLLWHLPQDLKFFKNTTWAMPVIMGRKTFEAVGSKPLPGRYNIVVTRQDPLPGTQENLVFVPDIAAAIQAATEATGAKEIFIAGGAQIYDQTFAQADRIYMTRVHAAFEADAFYPAIDATAWDLLQSNHFNADEKHAYPFNVQVWERKKQVG